MGLRTRNDVVPAFDKGSRIPWELAGRIAALNTRRS